MRERVVEKYFNEQVKKHGGRTKKLTSQVGDVDRIVLWPSNTVGIVHFIELKAPNGQLSDAQKLEHHWLNNHGFYVKALWCKEQVDWYINALKAAGVIHVK